MGTSSGAVGDLTFDGRAELILGASGSGTLQGEARLLEGRAHSGAAGLDAVEWDLLTVLGSGPGGRYTANIYSLGDIDGGGSVDVAIHVATNPASLQVLTGESGFTAGFSMTDDLPDRAGDAFGTRSDGGFNPALGRLGQIDGAGGPEVLLASNESGNDAGDVRLWYAPVAGATPRSSADVVFSATATTGGVSAGFVGDVNGDGHPDLAVGERSAGSGAGLVTLYY